MDTEDGGAEPVNNNAEVIMRQYKEALTKQKYDTNLKTKRILNISNLRITLNTGESLGVMRELGVAKSPVRESRN